VCVCELYIIIGGWFGYIKLNNIYIYICFKHVNYCIDTELYYIILTNKNVYKRCEGQTIVVIYIVYS